MGSTERGEKKLDVAEMRMLRWMCGVTKTKMDSIRNERIGGTMKAGEISKRRTSVKVERTCHENM